MSEKSNASLWIQIGFATIVIAWLSYDFFFTVTTGATYTIRLDDKIQFNQNLVPFIIAIVIKLGIYVFFIWLIRDCFNKINKNRGDCK